MTTERIATRTGLSLEAGRLLLDGRPRVLLCSSLFYFRLPASQWRDRLERVRRSGYTAIETYLPWNHHELAPGEFDFTGERDVGSFLDLAAQAGLLVLARPGPYICSEWDGGALPARLTLQPGLRLRQAEPRYLAEVGRWFDAVLPVLAGRQYPRGGPVVAVQLENELDFFDCEDRTGYLTALRDLAEPHLEVPLVACAGQGDLAAATGSVPRLVPAANFYPSDRSPDLEQEVRHHRDTLAGHGLPLLVTETNRRHLTLRRLLASGGRLLAPYLQTSGWNFGLTPATGNWGDPGSLMSHGYDFAGYLDPQGRPRPEYLEAQLLARLVDTFGDELAGATPRASRAVLDADFPTAEQPSELVLAGGGALLALPNLGEQAGTARLAPPGTGGVEVVVPAGRCPLLPLDLPLHRWGVSGRLRWASAEILAAEVSGRSTTLVLASDTEVELELELDGSPPRRLRLDPARDEATSWSGPDLDGRRLRLVARPRAELATDGPAADATSHHPDTREAGSRAVAHRRLSVVPATLFDGPPGHQGPARSLEAHGVHRGRGRYRARLDGRALLLRGACDLVDVRIGPRRLATQVPYGSPLLLDLDPGPVEVEVDTEIWGHPNFDDARRPALRLGALRGLGDALLVHHLSEVAGRWQVHGAEQWPDPAQPPLRRLGGWSSTRIGRPISYRRVLDLPSGCAVHLLHLAGLRGVVEVEVDGRVPVTVHPGEPCLELGPGPAVEVVVHSRHDPDRSLGRPQVLSGDPVPEWDQWGLDERTLTGHAEAAGRRVAAGDRGAEEPGELPVRVEPGRPRWIVLPAPSGPATGADALVHLDGTGLRLTGWSGGRCLGRVWLPGPERPRFSGGDSERLWLPGAPPGTSTAGASWLVLLAEATGGDRAGRLGSLRVEWLR